jgi:hypothetical protein
VLFFAIGDVSTILVGMKVVVRLAPLGRQHRHRVLYKVGATQIVKQVSTINGVFSSLLLKQGVSLCLLSEVSRTRHGHVSTYWEGHTENYITTIKAIEQVTVSIKVMQVGMCISYYATAIKMVFDYLIFRVLNVKGVASVSCLCPRLESLTCVVI